MTHKQTLHHFELACGVLPEDESDTPVIAEETPAPFAPPFNDHFLNDGIDLLPSAPDELIAENDSPPPPGVDGSSPSFPSGGGPPVFTPPFTGGLTPSGPTPPPPVPEPSSYILMLTGLTGAAVEIRRRFKS
ncbi:MAG TPA: PEP-CTERM sorting domain-containing protein [Edaphobacter sp.]|jgi:hypothetical protein|nr:PEP-CTERM sorting domain-containing protein [Edaphobacter sp.]